MKRKKILIDAANLTIHRHAFIRTGIQEVVFRVLQNVVELRDEFKDVDWLMLPHLPRTIAPFFENPVEVIREAERQIGTSSHGLWGFDLASKGYRVSDEEIGVMISQADVFHLQTLTDIGPLKTRARLSMTIYDLGPVLFPEYCDDRLARWFNSNYLPSAGRRLEQAVCISRNTAFDLEECPVTREIPRIKVLPLAYELPSASKPAENHDLLEKVGDEFVLFLGSLEPRKNFVALLRGFEAYKDLYPDSKLRLVMVGSTGWKNADIEKTIRTSRWHDWIVRTGYLSDDRLRLCMERSSALAMLSHYEGFGLPAAQAASLGVPVITNLGSSLPEATGDFGIFVDPNDPWSIVAGIRLALEGRACGGGTRGMQAVTWKAYTRELMRILVEL